MGPLKNLRHEAYCHEYIKTGNKTLSYLSIYDPTRTRIGYHSARTLGYQLMVDYPHIPKRIEELRVRIQKKADITIDKILTDYQHALELAKAQQKPDGIVNAATAQAKLVGLLRDRVETGVAGEFDAMDNISEILEKVATEAGPEAALALSKAFGLNIIEVETEAEDESDVELGGLHEAKPPSDAVN